MYSAINRDVALRPEATLKPKRFEFTPKTVTTDVFVVEVYWEAVPETWPDGSKASVAKCVVRPWNSTRSVGGREESTSWTFTMEQHRRQLSSRQPGYRVEEQKVPRIKTQNALRILRRCRMGTGEINNYRGHF